MRTSAPVCASEASTPNISTSSSVGHRANRLVRLVSGKESATRAGSGPSSCEWLARCAPDGSWQRIRSGFSQLTIDGHSEAFSGPWPRSGIVSAGRLGALPTLAGHISEIASSSSATTSEMWPTPVADNAVGGRGRRLDGTPYPKRHVGTTLVDAIQPSVRGTLWQTPWAEGHDAGRHRGRADSLHSQVKGLGTTGTLWPTPTATDAGTGRVNRSLSAGAAERPTLALLVRQWPTPQATSMRKSRKSLVENRQWSAPGLEQMAELATGILPREYHDPSELHGAAKDLWPTPVSADGQRGSSHYKRGNPTLMGRVKWPTPNAAKAANDVTLQASGDGRNQPNKLGWAVAEAATNAEMNPQMNAERLWSTPAAQDAKNATLPPSLARRDTLPGYLARQTTSEPGQPGVLNPAWVEALMNFPPGWTALAGSQAPVRRKRTGSRRASPTNVSPPARHG